MLIHVQKSAGSIDQNFGSTLYLLVVSRSTCYCVGRRCFFDVEKKSYVGLECKN